MVGKALAVAGSGNWALGLAGEYHVHPTLQVVVLHVLAQKFQRLQFLPKSEISPQMTCQHLPTLCLDYQQKMLFQDVALSALVAALVHAEAGTDSALLLQLPKL